MEKTIVKAEEKHIPELVRMRLSYLSEDTGFKTPEQKEEIASSLPGYFEKHLNKDLIVFLALAEGKAVSCAFLLITEKPMSPSFPNGLCGTVLNVYTEEQYRHQGYARALIQGLLKEGSQRGLSVIELKATEEGYPLYSKLGFQDVTAEYRLMKWKCTEKQSVRLLKREEY